MKKFLITGGAGFVGSHIAEKLVKRGDSVKILDNLEVGKQENLEKIISKINFVKGDIRDEKLLKREFEGVDGIFHQAAKTSVPESFKNPIEYHDVNVNGTKRVFEVAKEFGIKTVYASSSSVYGDQKIMPIKENFQKNPINPYAKTKAEDEKLAKKIVESGSEIIGLRYFNIFGERQSKQYAGVITLFLDRVKRNLPPKIFGDGLQTRDFVFVGDVVRANIMAMESNIKHGFFNVGTGKSISILELAKIMINYAGVNLEPIFEKSLEGDIKESLADISLIQEKLSWNPKVTLEEWLGKKFLD